MTPAPGPVNPRLARIRDWQARNPDKRRAYARSYYLRHRDEVIARTKAYKRRRSQSDRIDRYVAGLIPGANHNARWNAEEDNELLESTLPSAKLAWCLGRTPAAIRNRRYNLKHNHAPCTASS